MGATVIRLISEDPSLKLVAALEGPAHPKIGQDAGLGAGTGPLGVLITTDLTVAADVVIDFSLPEGTVRCAKLCAGSGTAMVAGTTGLDEPQLAKLRETARAVPVVFSPNMSIGVNLLLRLVGDVAKALGDDYDVEIVEMHHRFKKDAPSGTALKLAQTIANATGRDLKKDGVFGRAGAVGERKQGEIGIHAIRGGDVVGDHTITFATLGERIELTHKAGSRDTFARGALRAAKFVVGKKPGLYSMMDVLGL
jgi:4-hydroxy-tetrahydrodipicolinate reductase